MASIEFTEQAEADVFDVLKFTLERARGSAASTPTCWMRPFSRSQNPVRGRSLIKRPGVLGHHIRQLGQKARHVVFYRYDAALDHVTVLRILHDSMDFDRHLA